MGLSVVSEILPGQRSELPFAQQHSLHPPVSGCSPRVNQNLNERPATMLHTSIVDKSLPLICKNYALIAFVLPTVDFFEMGIKLPKKTKSIQILNNLIKMGIYNGSCIICGNSFSLVGILKMLSYTPMKQLIIVSISIGII